MKKYILAVLIVSLLMVSSSAQEDDNWGDTYYAPYVYMPRYPVYQLSQIAEETGVRYFTLAFILSGAECEARWVGTVPIDSSYIYNFLIEDLAKLREMGGDVIIAFGGALGNDLAQTCTDVESLVEQYQAVIDVYGVTHLDFDIEGDDINEPEVIERRSEAIAQLQANNNHQLVISYTLPVRPTGLTEAGMAVVEAAIEADVAIDVVNIMAMNYGSDFPPEEMGENTIQAAESLYSQLQSLYPDKDDEELWRMVGLTPMAGMNDRGGEIFEVQDAEQVLEFAINNGIRLLSIWSLDRDQACEYVNVVTNDCSGTEQEAFAFSLIFNQLTADGD